MARCNGKFRGCKCAPTSATCVAKKSCDQDGCNGGWDSEGVARCQGNFREGCPCNPTSNTCGKIQSCSAGNCAGQGNGAGGGCARTGTPAARASRILARLDTAPRLSAAPGQAAAASARADHSVSARLRVTTAARAIGQVRLPRRRRRRRPPLPRSRILGTASAFMRNLSAVLLRVLARIPADVWG